jgi:2-amino-4-hydroxy-6-hydroxymethyldihydropteridine diphosphokinase
MSRCFIGVGANLGDPVTAIANAVAEIASREGLVVTACSSLYRTAPVEAEGPDFFNAVVCAESSLTSEELLAVLQAIEFAGGRERPFPNAPRTLDLDLLLDGDIRLASPRLTLPHPRMHRRAFVLAPLVEIAPQITIPDRGLARTLLDECRDQRIERLGRVPFRADPD